MGETWRDNKNVIQCNRYMLNQQQNLDVRFSVGGPGEEVTIGAHKYVLSARSVVFQQMFYGTIGEQYQNAAVPIPVPDVVPEAFRKMLL